MQIRSELKKACRMWQNTLTCGTENDTKRKKKKSPQRVAQRKIGTHGATHIKCMPKSR